MFQVEAGVTSLPHGPLLYTEIVLFTATTLSPDQQKPLQDG